MEVMCSTSVRTRCDLEEALRFISSLGYDKADVVMVDGWVHINPTDLVKDFKGTIARVEWLFSRYGVYPWSCDMGTSMQLHERSAELDAQRVRETKAVVDFCRYFGIKIAGIQPKAKIWDGVWEEYVDRCVQSVREMKEVGDASGVNMIVELHVNSPFETLDQCAYLAEKIPDLQYAYDASHFVMQGYDIRETEWILRKAAHIHLRDSAKGRMQTPFGEGTMDFDWLLGKLREIGYGAHFSLEFLEYRDDEKGDLASDIKNMHAKLREYFDV